MHPVPKLVTSPAQIPEIDSTSSWKGLHGNIFMERASENMWPYLIYSRVVISHYKTFLIRIFSALSTPFPGVDLESRYLNIHKELPIITDFLGSLSDHQMASLLSQAGVLKVSTKFHLDVPLKLRTPVIWLGGSRAGW